MSILSYLDLFSTLSNSAKRLEYCILALIKSMWRLKRIVSCAEWSDIYALTKSTEGTFTQVRPLLHRHHTAMISIPPRCSPWKTECRTNSRFFISRVGGGSLGGSKFEKVHFSANLLSILTVTPLLLNLDPNFYGEKWSGDNSLHNRVPLDWIRNFWFFDVSVPWKKTKKSKFLDSIKKYPVL